MAFEWENVIEVEGKMPQIHETAYIDPFSRIIGDVSIEEGAGIYPGVVLRADEGSITIGRNAIILDTSFIEAPFGSDVDIGEATLISHGVLIHGGIVGSSSLLGIRSILLDQARIGRECIISASSLIPPRREIEDRSLIIGSPAKKKRSITDQDVERIKASHQAAWSKARFYGNLYGSAPMKNMTSGMGRIEVDREIFHEAPEKLKTKMQKDFTKTDFEGL